MFPKRNFKIVNRKIRKKGKLSYSSKSYKNPFFSKKKRTSLRFSNYKFSLKTKLIAGIASALIVLAVLFLFYSNYFSIKKIVVQGGGRIDPAQIENMTWQQIDDNFLAIIPQKNLFLFSKKKLIKNLSNKYSFESLAISKKLPGSLEIKYKEKEYAIIWQENENYFYADDYGLIISEVNLLEISQKDYPIIKNDSGNFIMDKKITVENSLIEYAKQLFIKFKEYNSEFKIERFVLDSDVDTVKVTLESGPTIYFNTKEEIEKQISKLLVIKNEKLKEDYNSKTYIDVRYGDSVYYR
ncbi:hypothetical protein DRH27_02135 [Candidatus Falkowbacteria bacterium]|nr:MAG: hypothetical protein DRH27_02135 [Candidatus Falkowbacteria bacterium]